MERYYELYKILIIVTTLAGVYLFSIEKIFGDKWYIKSLKVLVIFPSLSLSTFLVTYLKFTFFDEAELSLKIYGFVILIYSFMTMFTFLSFYLNRMEFERIFQLWESLFSEELFSQDRQALLEKNRRLTINWLLAFGGPSVICCLIYCLITYFSPEKKLPHPSGIPYRHETPDFEMVATLDLFASIFGFSLLITYDSLTMALLSQEEAQFVHLKRSLGRIIEIINVTNSGEIFIKNGEDSNDEIVNDSNSWKVQRAFEEADKNLKVWISHHKDILRFHDELQRIYSYSYSMKYLIFILIICFCCFLAITGSLDFRDIAMTTVFCVNVYATFYINIKYADSTADTAESLFGEAFAKTWYLFPKKLRTAFHIIIMQSRRPVQYKILWVYPLNPRSFLKILTSAYTFFTFLLQVNRTKV